MSANSALQTPPDLSFPTYSVQVGRFGKEASVVSSKEVPSDAAFAMPVGSLTWVPQEHRQRLEKLLADVAQKAYNGGR
jgi:hypothetical protein